MPSVAAMVSQLWGGGLAATLRNTCSGFHGSSTSHYRLVPGFYKGYRVYLLGGLGLRVQGSALTARWHVGVGIADCTGPAAEVVAREDNGV